MSPTPNTLVVASLALLAGVMLGLLVGNMWRRRGGGPSTVPVEAGGGAGRPDGGERIRSQALEAVAEPVLVVSVDGRILECNAAALILLDRHRPAVHGMEASAIRKLVSPGGGEVAWRELVEARSPWAGEAHVRLPDESRRAVAVRSVPIFSPKGDLAALAEVYRDGEATSAFSADRFLRALDALDESTEREEPAAAAERELRLLALGLADLDRVLRQYETLLPAMSAEDPVTEAIAGLAAETREVATTADVPRLLREIPRSMTRLRAHITRLVGDGGSGAPPPGA